jgi:hypothetical protein
MSKDFAAVTAAPETSSREGAAPPKRGVGHSRAAHFSALIFNAAASAHIAAGPGAFLSAIDVRAALWAFLSAFAVVSGAAHPAKEYRFHGCSCRVSRVAVAVPRARLRCAASIAMLRSKQSQALQASLSRVVVPFTGELVRWGKSLCSFVPQPYL